MSHHLYIINGAITGKIKERVIDKDAVITPIINQAIVAFLLLLVDETPAI
mgnify:CR=1 FL=1